MAYTYNTFYDQAHIPCTASDNNAAVESGFAQVNIDGKTVRGGIKVGNQCLSGWLTTPTQGLINPQSGNNGTASTSGPYHLFFAGNASVKYAIGGVGMANNTNAIRLMRANHL